MTAAEVSRLSVSPHGRTDNRDTYASNNPADYASLEDYNLRIVRRWEAEGVLCPLCRCFRVFRDWGHCGHCHPSVVEQERRAAAREARVAQAPPCEACGGPLWPEGDTPRRARSDRKTCSDRCRQKLRRRKP